MPCRGAGQRGGQRGGAVPGVEDDQRSAAVVVPGHGQPTQQVPRLSCGLAGAGRLRGALHVHDCRPRGAQVPGRGEELVLPPGDGLAGPVAPARVMMDVLALAGIGETGLAPRHGTRFRAP